MRNKIIILAFIMVTASASNSIFINNETTYEVILNDLTTNTQCPIKKKTATNIIVNSDYSISCADKINYNADSEIGQPLPHSITLTKDTSIISNCISGLPKNDILIYIQNAGTSAKPKLICKNFPPA